MRDGIREACEAVQAHAAGKDKAAIRRMLTEELRSREVSLPPDVLEVVVEQIAAGTYVPGEPIVSVHWGGLLRVPFARKALRQMFRPVFDEFDRLLSSEVFRPEGEKGTGHDLWSALSQMYPHPPGRGLYAAAPEEVPPPAPLIPDPDLRERIPGLFKLPPSPPGPHGEPPQPWPVVAAWLEDSGGTIAVYEQHGRIGVLNAEDAEAYLPLARAAHAQDEVVPAAAEIRAVHGLLSATVWVMARPSDPAARTSSSRGA
jgi:hypothetical protein